MKRILNVSYFSFVKLKNCYINDINKKITNGFIRNGYEVIDYSDRDVCRFLGFGRKNIIGFKRLQNHFVEFCKSCRPDAILLCHADTITPETLKRVKEELPNVKIMQYNIDAICPSLPNGLANAEKIKTKLDVVDATVVSTGDEKLLSQFKRENQYLGYIPNMVDRSLETHKMFEKESAKFDIIFGGTNGKRQFCGKPTLYMDIIELIKTSIDDVKLNVFGLNKKNKLEGPDYQGAYGESLIGLNLSAVNDNYLYSSDRMAHIMGNGLLCMVDKQTGFNDIFSEDEVCFYETPEDFAEKLKYYVENPQERMRVAKNGYEKYHKEMSEIMVTKYLADILFGQVNKDNYIWTKLVDMDNK
tara:strand:- start:3632 stop:4705 length:1074 start_codon:yes stop_codon:yes gene_type:complete